MKKIVIIGANEFQKKLIIKANDLGYETHVFAWEEGAVAKEEADFFYPISITDKEIILDYAKQINPVGICSIASDLAMPTVNYIANKLGLASNTLECTEQTTNKFQMRRTLKFGNLPCPEFQLVKNCKDIDFNKLSLPLIIKPIDRSGSRGVYKIDNINDLEVAIDSAKKVSFNENVLVEEYIEGKEYSVEFISQNNVHKFIQVTEKFTSGAPNFIEKGHLAPARLSNNKKKEIVNIVERSLEALGVENGASHSEVKIMSNGDIKIIEVAARMGGDFIGSDMVNIATGYDFLKNTINVSVREKIDLNFYSHNKVALVGFVFNRYDKERFELLRDLFPNIIKEYGINENMNIVKDSSSRNGYYILEFENEELLSEVLNTLKMEE